MNTQGNGRTTLFRQYVKRLFLPGLLSFLLASLGSAWIGLNIQKNDLLQHRLTLLESFSEALVKPLWDCDNSTVSGILHAMVYQEDFAQVRLSEDCRNETLEATRPGDESRVSEAQLVMPLEYVDEHGRSYEVGTLEVWLRSHSIQRFLTDNSWRYLTLLALLLVLVYGVSLVVFRTLITIPLHRFQAIIRQNNHRQDAPRAKACQILRTNNELGELARIYDSFMEQLDQTMHHLGEKQTQLEHMAHTDSLTGLGNRLALDLILSEALSEAVRTGRSGCLLLLDLDDFKPVNDRYGHAAGDRVLAEVGRRLRACLRKTDSAIRLGGDEFVVVAPHLDDVQELIAKVHADLTQPYLCADAEIRLGVSIGTARFPEDGQTTDRLLHVADLSMYEEKRNTKDVP